MRLARVKGLLTATAKDPQLTGQRFLVVDYVDGDGAALERGHVVLDACGAGHGEEVVVTTGGAARLPAGTAGTPADAAAVAIVDSKSFGKTPGKP